MDINKFLPQVNELKIDKDNLFNVRKNIEYNKVVEKYYKRLLFNSRYITNATYRERAKEYDKFDESSIDWKAYEKVTTLENKISNLSTCNSLWLMNVYDSQKIKAFEKTNLCRDKFCNNCKKVKQAGHMSKFIPEIEKYKDYNLYHLVLTVPNVQGKHLREMVDYMFKAFALLIRYFKGDKRISGYDFEKYGYVGAIRSLEVTFKGDSYHPHLHVLLALDYEEEEKIHTNRFSRRFGKIVRKFSDTEVMLQRLWQLLITKQGVSAKKILSEKQEGYSVIMDEFKEDDYFELFKYMTKSSNDEGESFSYDNFIDLYFQLKSKRQIQGYGCFFRIKDIDLEDEINVSYDTLISILDSVETPRISAEKVEDLYFDNEYIHISKNKIRQTYLKKIEEKEKDIDDKFDSWLNKFQKKEEGCEPSSPKKDITVKNS